MKNKKTITWIRIIGFLFGLTVFILAFYSIRLRELWSLLHKSFNVNLVLCVAAWMLSIIFQTWRWQIMLSTKQSVPFYSALKFYILNRLTNLFFAFRLGEGVRIFATSKKLKISVPFIMATVINERILNVVFLIIIAFGLTFYISDLEIYRNWLLYGMTTMLAVGTMYLWQNRFKLKDISTSAVEKSKNKNRFKDFWIKFVHGLSILKIPLVLYPAVLNSIGAWCSLWLGILMLLKNFGPLNPPLSAIAVLFFINIASLFPVTPSNLGPFQWSCIFALSYFGISKTEAVAFSLVLQGVRIIAAMLMGILAIVLDSFFVHVLNQRSRKL